jgi:hypothetical protein
MQKYKKEKKYLETRRFKKKKNRDTWRSQDIEKKDEHIKPHKKW